MSEARHLTPSHSDVINDGLLGESLRVELEPDHVQKISQNLASPAGRNGPEDPGEADSDSGDSMFLTQRCVPEAVRTRRKKAPDFMSDFGSDGNPEFYEEHTSSSVSDEDPKLVKKTWKKTYKLPKYKFSFLSKTRNQGSAVLPGKQNRKLHNYATGGFFNCVQEMWKSYEKFESQMSFLPTVDMIGKDISPISEEEEGKEESLEDRDFKVVRKKQLVVSLKPKRSQPWYSPQESEVRQQKSTAGNAACVSEGRRLSAICKVLLKRITLLPDTDSSYDASGLVQTEAPKTPICLELGRENTVFRQQENAEQLGYDSDAPVCGPSPEKRARKVAEAAVTEPHADAGWEPGSQNPPKGAENGALCSEARVKRKKKEGKGKGNYESVLGGNGQSGEEAERQRAAADASEATAADASEATAADASEATAAEEPSSSSQAVNEPTISGSKRKKKYKADDVRPELEDQRDEREGGASVVSVNVESSGKKKKKDVNDRVGQSDRGEMQKERKKKKALKDTPDVPETTTEHSEENAQETSEPSSVKRKKLKKKKKRSASNDGIQFEEDACVEVDQPSDVITVTDVLAPVSDAPEEDEDVGNTQEITEILEEQDCELLSKKKRRKKKKKMREKSKSEDSIAQSDDLASEWKKERERTPSFLAADGEEEAGQTHAPHDRGAEKPDISTGRLASESPDMTESLNRSDYGLKKKNKRKRSTAEEGAEREKDLEEGDKTSPGAVGVTEAWPKEKKKHKRSKSVQMSPMEGWETAADVGHFHTDEAVVFRTKKKKKKKLEAATEDAESEKSSPNASSSLPPKEKRKRGHSTETLAHISSAHERETGDPDISSLSSPKKHKKAKRRLHNPSEDFLTER